MRVLFTSWAGGGHFAPLVPVGWALRAAGHEVLVVSHPSDVDPIVRAGLTALPVGPDTSLFRLLRAQRKRSRRPGADAYPADDPNTDTARHPPDFHDMLATALAVTDRLADDLVAFCRTWRPDLVVYEPASLVGPLVAQLLRIPAVRQLWTCDFTAPANGFPVELTHPLLARFGLTALDPAGNLTLDPCPPRLQAPDDLPRQPIRYIPYNGPARYEAWLREPPRRRRICVTWGTSLHSLGIQRMFHVARVVRALGTLDADVVVAVLDEHRYLFQDRPANVVSVGPVPLHLLLPSCDAIVHQGGGGTLMTAVAHGVPQVVVPSITDQVFNAGHLAASGAGVHVPGREDVTEEAVLSSTVEVLTDPAYRSAATMLRAEHLARPTPAQVVPELERLASAGTPSYQAVAR
jgi:UDP:flavonoid glycosyltransferase YjiC (YdhE family)